MIIDCAHYQDGRRREWLIRHMESPAAFVYYGIGGLIVPLTLLFLWLRLRRPQPGGDGATSS